MSPHPSALAVEDHILVSGIHLELTPAFKAAAREKAAKLLRHQPRIIRVRIDLELDHTRGNTARFVAKGRVEIEGPDLLGAAASEDAYKSLDALISLLDRALRKRQAARKERRNHPHAAEIGEGLPKVA